jgi:hypothetical protein
MERINLGSQMSWGSGDRCEASWHFRNKKKEYPEAKMRNLKISVRFEILGTCTYRDISHFKRGSQPRNNVIQNEKCDLFTDSKSILIRLRN